MPSPLRYRPFRASTWGVYLVLAFGFVGLVVYAVAHGVLTEQQRAVAQAGSADPKDCAAELEKAYGDIHAELDAARLRSTAVADAGADGWPELRARLTALGARCGLQGGATPLALAYARVVRFQRLAESAAVQYQHEVGPADLEAWKLVQAATAP